MKTRLLKPLLVAAAALGFAMLIVAWLPAQSQPSSTGWSAYPIPVLVRQAPGTPDSSLARLLEGLALQSSARETRSDGVRVARDKWRLDVFGDGSSAEFVDEAVVASARDYAVDPAAAMSAQAFESAGRAYIDRRLSRTIVLQVGERLVSEKTSFRTEGGVARDGTDPVARVVEARVVFSREIDGIPVVGAGSKVTIGFRSDGEVESFRYDWPNYARTQRDQRVASSFDILRRLQQVASLRTRVAVAGAVEAPSNIENVTQPMDLGGGVTLEDLKCGYYDPGLKVRDAAAPLQTGCYYHVIQSQGRPPYVTTSAYSGAVPAATSPERDVRWPEAQILQGQPVMAAPAPSAKSTGNARPVPPRPEQ
jgi:hypothetical protein